MLLRSCDDGAAEGRVIVEHIVNSSLAVEIKLRRRYSELLGEAVIDGLCALLAEFLVDLLVAGGSVGIAADGELRSGGLQDLCEETEVHTGLLGEFALAELESHIVRGGDGVGGLDDLRLGLELGEFLLKTLALCLQFGEGDLVG